MGILGLRNYIRRHNKLHEFTKKLGPYLSADSVLIIEAPNLIHKFHEHMGLDSLCGGQYEEFYQGLIEFFSTLRHECPRLKVIMLLVEVTELDKMEVVRMRKMNKLKRWEEAIEQAEPFSGNPCSAWDVLFEAVRVCGVETVHYDSEADDFVSALALHYAQQGKPAFILSEDTDFCLTVGITGVLSIEGVGWSPGSRTRPVWKESKFFSLSDFLRVDNWLAWMIPVLAILLGNDLTPQVLKSALEPIKAEFSSLGRGHIISKMVFYLTRCSITEAAALASIRHKLSPGMCEVFDGVYERSKNRYLRPLANIDPGDVPTPQLKRMRQLYPGVSHQSLLRIGLVWSNRVSLTNKEHLNAEDYRQPPASLASIALRSYWHGVILLPTQPTSDSSPPKYVTEISRCYRKERREILGNVVSDELVEVFYKVGECYLPSLYEVQEMSKGDKIQMFRRIMHCSACHAIFSDTELINYDVSIILSTLYYWYHQISFRENKSISAAVPLPPSKRQELLWQMLVAALSVYFQDQLILPALSPPDARSATRHECYHSVAEWLRIQRDANILLTALDLPTVCARRSYNGHVLFRGITDKIYLAALSAALSSLLRGELHNTFQDLLSPCSELK